MHTLGFFFFLPRDMCLYFNLFDNVVNFFFVSVCMIVCLQVHMCIHALEAGGQPRVLFLRWCLSCFKTGSLTGLNLAEQARLADLQTRLLRLFPQHLDYRHVPAHVDVYVRLSSGAGIQLFMLATELCSQLWLKALNTLIGYFLYNSSVCAFCLFFLFILW